MDDIMSMYFVSMYSTLQSEQCQYLKEMLIWDVANHLINWRPKTTGPGNNTCKWFGEVCSCCCLPLQHFRNHVQRNVLSSVHIWASMHTKLIVTDLPECPTPIPR